jgi:nicotinic acid phosphoribosyltransferase
VSSLLTDLYQLTLIDAYYRLGMQDTAVFEFIVRRLPDTRNFLVAAGLEQVLNYLEIDSGDLTDEARRVRTIFDSAGCAVIFASW